METSEKNCKVIKLLKVILHFCITQLYHVTFKTFSLILFKVNFKH